MQKETIYRNHYKTHPNLANTIIFFHMSWFYKTFDSDARVVSQLLGSKIIKQDWVDTASFLETSTYYLERLEDGMFSYVILELSKDGNISILRRFTWNKPLDINIPLDVFQNLLNDIQHLHDKYSTSLRLIQPIDLPISYNKPHENSAKDVIFSNINPKDIDELEKWNNNQINTKEIPIII